MKIRIYNRHGPREVELPTRKVRDFGSLIVHPEVLAEGFGTAMQITHRATGSKVTSLYAGRGFRETCEFVAWILAAVPTLWAEMDALPFGTTTAPDGVGRQIVEAARIYSI